MRAARDAHACTRPRSARLLPPLAPWPEPVCPRLLLPATQPARLRTPPSRSRLAARGDRARARGLQRAGPVAAPLPARQVAAASLLAQLGSLLLEVLIFS